ncbi:LPXTG-motif cell wall-anchored protein [Enterococcus rivorum]|uniref:Multifunctional 2',3'-cyclic-nucleotide 2'-phosphodiesterase/5'-nucleotidase/3'-nucleotidase n=1 Tax=Enterococcus rivorum TaxID=762845 RepID=A0A1E5KUK3_9ENTE|nr:5'-nucleotidase C-terminal domain-containing protein [Enterococcus rivorum]MBP2098968.1 LPXTG-motif cell wall-anchored protein [Enterococcus rivorum]OEH81438.1 multifunctional 2',3'-cyclic-nucleotide 2'-phosphodiesterase/5'-nucleotidase/3'-nucleotidase [Enterococcus rivorum]
MKKKKLKQFKLGFYLVLFLTIVMVFNVPTALAIENSNNQSPKEETVQNLTILGTSDVHGQLWNWSYEDDKQIPVGLSQVSTVVKNIRAENPNGTLLIDNGDIIQGTILTDDLYNKKPLSDQKNPVIQAMNYMEYDAMVLGNHEFNFGLDLIKKIEDEASFPLLSANTYLKTKNQRFVKGTTKKEIDLDGDGTKDLTVGIIGLTIPHIPFWDGGKVESLRFEPLKEEAELAVAEFEGTADIIVASIHAGRQNSDPAASADQVISNVSGIDAYILGHDHRSFAEKVQGPTKLVPIGGPRDTGVQMVRIDLAIEKNTENKWQVKNSQAEIIDTTKVAADSQLKEKTKEYHETTRTFISKPIGTATGDFLPKEEVKGIPEAQLRPTAMISLINNVQRKVTGAQIGAAALFKADSKLNAGNISYSNVFDIYKYPNTLVSVNITGANLLKYMENQAAYYNTPQPDDLTISFNKNIRVYNYDIFSGINYKIDISKPAGERIINPTIEGKPVNLQETYTIAMNNYRYEGLLSQKIVTEAPLKSTDPETLRGFIADYIQEKGTLDPEKEIEKNWEVVGYHFNSNWRKLAVQLVNDGVLKTEASADGRTPNVKAITKQEVINAGYEPTIVTIMHTNDVHGRMEGNGKDVLGMARLKTYKDIEEPELLIDAGDALQGLPISNFSKGMDMVEIMNAVGYDAMAVGNHEFDFGFETAMKYQEAMNFPLLSANTYKGNERIFKPYTIVEKAGKNYAIIGVTTPETGNKTHPNNVKGLTFKEPIDETKKVIHEIQKSGKKIDAFIVTGHLGIDETTPEKWRGDTLAETLSKEFGTLNITVLDGHSHTAVKGGKRFGNVIYNQTGNYLNNVGMVTIDLVDFSKKEATLTSAQNLATLQENSTIKTLVDAAAARFKEWGSKEVIPYNPFQFNGERDNVRTRETNLGNVISDAMLAYGQDGFSNPSDFAVTNGGGIRANIEPGAITLGDIIAVLPFGNSIAQIEVTGAQVKEMFEMSLRSAPQKAEDGTILLDDYKQPKLGANGGFLHVSSTIRVHYDSVKKGTLLPNDEGNGTGKNIVGERVLQVEIQNRETGKFEPIDKKKTYRMATNDFLAAGGDGYTMLGGEREEGPSLDTVFINYLERATAIRAYDATSAVDLTQYKEPFPGKRIVSISEKDFNSKQIPKPEEEKEKEKEKPKDKTDKKQEFPLTGEQVTTYFGIGFVIILISGSIYVYRKKKAS